VIALTLAGCGGESATRQAVIARGDAICSSTLSAIRAVPPPTGSSTSALGAYLRKVRPIVDAEAAKLTALPRPAARRATLAEFLAAVRASDRAYREAAAAAARGDADGVAEALASLRTSRVTVLARRYGLGACTGTAATVS
jgi:hypothetical protein